MGIDIHYKVAKPSLLIYGSPIPTILNLAVLVICILIGRLLTGICTFFITQIIIIGLSYYNIFFFEEYIAYFVTIKLFRKDNYYV